MALTTQVQVAHTRTGATYVLLPDFLVRSKGYSIQMWALESGHPTLVRGERINASTLTEDGSRHHVTSTTLVDVQRGLLGTPQLYNLSPFEMQLVRAAAAAARVPLERSLRDMVGK